MCICMSVCDASSISASYMKKFKVLGTFVHIHACPVNAYTYIPMVIRGNYSFFLMILQEY